MNYLVTRPRKLVTVYLPLLAFLFVLLFPFYWMALTAIKPDEQLIDMVNATLARDASGRTAPITSRSAPRRLRQMDVTPRELALLNLLWEARR